MLTIAKDWVQKNINQNIQLRLAGQESIPQTYALCKSDMMISGEEPGDIRYGNSISEDKFSGERFDYMITNPPYGDRNQIRNLWTTRKEPNDGSQSELHERQTTTFSST